MDNDRIFPNDDICDAYAVNDDLIAGPDCALPPYVMPRWISSFAVQEEIKKLAVAGADKSVCWDLLVAIDNLVASKGRE